MWVEVEVLCWMDLVWYSVLCCDPSVHLNVPSIGFVYVMYVRSYLLMVFLCVILHTMWSGKSMQLLCILPFGMLCFVCHQYDVCKHSIGSVYVGGYGGISESCVFRELCPVSFPVVGESPSILL